MAYVLLDEMIYIVVLGSIFSFLLQERQQLSLNLLRVPGEESAWVKKWGDEDRKMTYFHCCGAVLVAIAFYCRWWLQDCSTPRSTCLLDLRVEVRKSWVVDAIHR